MRPRENKNPSFPCFVPAGYQGQKYQISQACPLKKWNKNTHVKWLANRIKRQEKYCLEKRKPRK